MKDSQSIKKVIGYCRISTDNQKDNGTIEVQEIAISEHAKINTYELILFSIQYAVKSD